MQRGRAARRDPPGPPPGPPGSAGGWAAPPRRSGNPQSQREPRGLQSVPGGNASNPCPPHAGPRVPVSLAPEGLSPTLEAPKMKAQTHLPQRPSQRDGQASDQQVLLPAVKECRDSAKRYF